jgi:hypothetical protein
LELIGFTSGQFWGFWGRWVAGNTGGFSPAPELALGVDAFEGRKRERWDKNGVHGDVHGGLDYRMKEWGGLSAFACFKGFDNELAHNGSATGVCFFG